jgi:hypothetical protein
MSRKPPTTIVPTRFPESEIEDLDESVLAHGFGNRSEFIRAAVKRMRDTALPSYTGDFGGDASSVTRENGDGTVGASPFNRALRRHLQADYWEREGRLTAQVAVLRAMGFSYAEASAKLGITAREMRNVRMTLERVGPRVADDVVGDL